MANYINKTLYIQLERNDWLLHKSPKKPTSEDGDIISELSDPFHTDDDDSYAPSTSGEDSDEDWEQHNTVISQEEILDISVEKNSSLSCRQDSFQNEDNISTNMDTTLFNALDDANMFISGRNKSKKLFCFYCKSFQAKFARHLENQHKNEIEVKKIIGLPKGSKERVSIIRTIRNQSQFFHNTSSDYNNGELIVCRRPTQQKISSTSAQNFKVCVNCKGFFSKNNIRHHARKCFKYSRKTQRNLLVMGRKIVGRIHPDASKVVRDEIFPVLREDEIVRNIRYDRLVILYANYMAAKYKLRHQHDMIRAHIRLIGRFLLAIKNINNKIGEYSDIFVPSYYDFVVSAIYKVPRYNDDIDEFEAPSTASSISSIIKKCADVLIADCIKQKNPSRKQLIEDFVTLLVHDVTVSVNKTVMETQTKKYRRKLVQLPSLEDIQKLRKYLINVRAKSIVEIKKDYSFHSWLEILQTTLVSVQLFNRRRAGEIERIYIEDFEANTGIPEDILRNCTSADRHVASNYVRFEIRGKLNRSVPVLLSQEMRDSILIILQYRGRAGVPQNNRFIFGVPSKVKAKLKYARACALMRKYSSECGAKLPNTLRGTQLRKHVATNCINLNLSEMEISDVANFMGHSDKIHKDIYRQPVISREIIRMSNVLEKALGDDIDSDSDDDENCKTLVRHVNAESSEVSGIHELDEVPGTSRGSTGKKKSNGTAKRRLASPRKKRSTSPFGTVKRKVRWTLEEVDTAKCLFKNYIENHTFPSLKEIQGIRMKYPCFKNRSAAVIKTWISNQIRKMN